MSLDATQVLFKNTALSSLVEIPELLTDLQDLCNPLTNSPISSPTDSRAGYYWHCLDYVLTSAESFAFS